MLCLWSPNFYLWLILSRKMMFVMVECNQWAKRTYFLNSRGKYESENNIIRPYPNFSHACRTAMNWDKHQPNCTCHIHIPPYLLWLADSGGNKSSQPPPLLTIWLRQHIFRSVVALYCIAYWRSEVYFCTLWMEYFALHEWNFSEIPL